MANIANLVVDGSICQICGQEMGDTCGHPRSCASCDGGAQAMPEADAAMAATWIKMARRHGWTASTHNHGWHVALRRGLEQLDIWISGSGRIKWRDRSVGGRGRVAGKTLELAIKNAAPSKETTKE